MGAGYLFFIMGILFFIMLAFTAILRNFLKVEKPKPFSYNHISRKHKKIDFGIRIIFTIIMLILFTYTFLNLDTYADRLSPMLMILFPLFFIATETTRAFMEWKYADNPRAYIFTIGQLIFILIFFWVIFSSSFFNPS